MNKRSDSGPSRFNGAYTRTEQMRYQKPRERSIPKQYITEDNFYPTADIRVNLHPRSNLDYRGTLDSRYSLDDDDGKFCDAITQDKLKAFDTAVKLRSVSLGGQGYRTLDPSWIRGKYERAMMHYASHVAVNRIIKKWSEVAKERSVSLELTCSASEKPVLFGWKAGTQCCRPDGSANAIDDLRVELETLLNGATDEDIEFFENSQESWLPILERVSKGEYLTEEEEEQYDRL